MKTIFTLITILTMASHCNNKMETTGITKIEFGTSFGNCLGYCIQMSTYTDGQVTKKLSPSRSQGIAPKECSKKWSGFHLITSKIDMIAFNDLEETIGCPDCADGGAEWIQIFTSDGSKKVTYEYGKEPAVVEPFISELRKQFNSLGECE